MKNLYIDIETYSPTSLKDCGVYKYAEDPEAELLLFSYSVDGEPIIKVNVIGGENIRMKSYRHSPTPL